MTVAVLLITESDVTQLISWGGVFRPGQRDGFVGSANSASAQSK